MAAIRSYDENAEALVAQYESLPFAEVHRGILNWLPKPGSVVLDVGAGSGRDAAWFAARGDQIVAVEPSDEMRQRARKLHQSPNIRWLSDSLPDLSQVYRLGLTYDLIILSAVWMHIPPSQRERSLRKLTALLAPNGRVVISLRLGVPDTAREMHSVSLSELAYLGQQFGLRVVHSHDSDDRLGRNEVSWTTAILGLPDDALGTLPLLRNLILRDEKSSTYKIALLRILARIADVAGGAARFDSESVVLPLGLIALFWLRMYKPLIEEGLPQLPRSRTGSGPGFATENFKALRSIPGLELRVGAVFGGNIATALHRSLSEVSQLIRIMPAGHMFWPASDSLIFDVQTKRRASTPGHLNVDEAFLWTFGEFLIPTEIWQALSHYNVWVEPVLVAEWVRLMTVYAGQNASRVRERAFELLAWGDPARDTRLAREAVDRLRQSGSSVFCVWTGARLREQFEIDHCFPFSAWPCDDLWNLMPTSKRVNLEKSNRLVTGELLQTAAERIAEWWQGAYLNASSEATIKFFAEAAQTLPMQDGQARVDDVLHAMQLHRLRLQRDQGLIDWAPAPVR
jgi:protein-L-isoaspartate O-methyltransferase